MSDFIYTATIISTDWPILAGSKLPVPLKDAIAVFQSVDTTPPAAVLDVDTLTPDTTRQAVIDYAHTKALASVWGETIQSVRYQAAMRVIRAATAAVPNVIENLLPDFNKAAEQYTDLVREHFLETEVSLEHLVNSDPSVLSAYQSACAAARSMSPMTTFLSEIGSLPTFSALPIHPEVRVIRPETRQQLSALMSATATSQAEDALNPLFLAAVRTGCEFGPNTPLEADEIVNNINSQPVEQKPITMVRV